MPAATDAAPPPDWLVTREVRADVRAPRARYEETAEFRSAVDGFDVAFQPTAKRPRPKGVGNPVDPVAVGPPAPTAIAMANLPPPAGAQFCWTKSTCSVLTSRLACCA